MLLGIESVVFGVDEADEAVRFLEDFGLALDARDGVAARFRLPEGSSVVVRRRDDPDLPRPPFEGPGVREVVWGVDSAVALARLGDELRRDRAVSEDPDGTLHTHDPGGLAIGFRLFERAATLADAPAPPENNLAGTKRWDRHRKWFDSARPKLINHVVYGVPEVEAAVAFYTEQLQFRVTDILRGFGVFMRCEGRHDHHNLLLFRAPKVLFGHVSFGVENIDELMTGANRMQRQGWVSDVGLGRHRASSMLFYYMKSPLGGQIEYSADSDYLTDAWRPRLWDPAFGQHHWVSRLSETARVTTEGQVEIVEGKVPALSETVRRPKL